MNFATWTAKYGLLKIKFLFEFLLQSMKITLASNFPLCVSPRKEMRDHKAKKRSLISAGFKTTTSRLDLTVLQGWTGAGHGKF